MSVPEAERHRRIGLDLAPLQPPYTGVSNYTLYLVDALLAQATPALYMGFGRFRWKPVDRVYLEAAAVAAGKRLRQAPAREHEHEGAAPSPRVGLRSLVRLAFRYPMVQDLYASAKAAAFSASVRGQRLDLFHAFSYRAPGHCDGPVIPVIYDLSHIRYPHMHPASRIRWMEPVAEMCRKALAVHTISDFSAREIASVFGVDQARIHVIPPGVADIFRHEQPLDRTVLARYGLSPGGYALTVSTLEPRKNLRTLITAFAALPDACRNALPLCVVGPKGWGDLDLSGDAGNLVRQGQLRFLGYVRDTELRHLYAGTRVMLYPSIYEGFGMPICEALACGAPVVASNAASMPQAAGSVGRLVAPSDVAAWTAEMRRAVEGTDHTDEAARSARKRHASSFTWEKAAQATTRMYNCVVGR